MSHLIPFARLGFCCLALALFVSTTCWAAQQPGSSSSYKRPDNGRIEQGRFINDYLGIDFSIPSGWSVTDVGDGQAEPHLVDGRKVYLLLRIVPSGSRAGGSQIVLRVVDVLHKKFDAKDLSQVDEALSDFRPLKHPNIAEIVHVENPSFLCGHYQILRSSNTPVYRTKCLVPGDGRRFLPVLTVDSADRVPIRTLEELAGSWQFTRSPSSQEEEEVHDWVQSNFAAVLEEYLPLQLQGEGIAHRSTRDLYTDVLEYSFVLQRDFSARRRSAVVRLANSRSVHDQMFLLRIEDPSITLEQVKARIRVNEWTVLDTDCPAVGTAMDNFWKAKVLRGREDVIILHPMVYEFHVWSMTMKANVTITDDEHPWAQWATETRARLQTCVAKLPASLRPPPKDSPIFRHSAIHGRKCLTGMCL